MHKTTRATITLISLSVGVSYLSERSSMAHPRYMKKEAVTSCGYCHTKEAGRGARNYRGNYYQMHDDSFLNFDDAAEAKAANVEVAPHAEMVPASAPLPPLPAVGAKSPLTPLWTQTHDAELAYEKDMKNSDLKTAYVTALVAYTHATVTSDELAPAIREASAIVLAKRTLVLDPTNVSAAADLKTAQDAKVADDAKVPTK